MTPINLLIEFTKCSPMPISMNSEFAFMARGNILNSAFRHAAYPVELLYFRGWWDLIANRSVAVVGTRDPSGEGVSRTRRLVKELIDDKFTIVSGLAKGIDTVAHTTAIGLGGWRTIGVGTPLSEAYPKKNAELQEQIASEYLLISQVPVWRYSQQGPHWNKLFFPAATMSALTEATIIVEAGETSGRPHEVASVQ